MSPGRAGFILRLGGDEIDERMIRRNPRSARELTELLQRLTAES
jgi:hypothetical protein